jgi:aryl-alcohol dehydrogenase-like predicted oxidoreductase
MVLLKNQNHIGQEHYLGTANFGQSYGLTRSESGLSERVIAEIFEFLDLTQNIHIDTSPDYGSAELIIGKIGKSRKFMERISTKIPQRAYEDAQLIKQSVVNSLKRLCIDEFETVLLHGLSEDFEKNLSAIEKGLAQILDNGLARSVGLSCYSESEVEIAKNFLPVLTVFQVPENAVDQRILNSSKLLELFNSENQIFVRSIFLQGKLLQVEDNLAGIFDDLKPAVSDLRRAASSVGLEPLEYCIAYAKSIPWSSGIAFGVESKDELISIISALHRDYPRIEFNNLKVNSNMVDPRNWVSR